MENIKRIFAFLLSVSALSAVVSCSKKNPEPEESSESSVTASEPVITGGSVKGQTIYWMADYDINPGEGEERSTALALFEDVYGGKVEYIPAPAGELTTALAERINAGEPVDMVPYEPTAFPYGTTSSVKLYQRLDGFYDTLEADTDLWSDMSSIIEDFSINGAHYVLPYSLSAPHLITYSRKIMESEGLEDPKELWEKGEWNWDTMTDMINKFLEKTPEGAERFGIGGFVGQAVLGSTGHTVITLENGTFRNNISDAEIEKAENYLGGISGNNLYRHETADYFPDNHSTLFLAMPDWSLGLSNKKNPDMDLMAVPFPNAPGADQKYITCDFNAKMLAFNSVQGEAVATYIKCERLVAASEKYREEAKKMTVGEAKDGFLTEEQYDAVQEYLDTSVTVPVVDFSYGAGSRMFSKGGSTVETRGVMNNLESSMLEQLPAPVQPETQSSEEGQQTPAAGPTEEVSWNALKNAVSKIIDEELAALNG